MEKNNTKALKIFSNVYYILSIVCVIILIIILAFSNETKAAIENAFKGIDLNGMESRTVLSISLGIEAVFYALFGWLSSRVAHKKSKGAIFIILLVINIVSSLIGLILDFNALGNIILALDAFTLYHVLEIRQRK